MALNFSRVFNLIRLLSTFGSVSSAILSCQTQTPEPTQLTPPSQRVAARTIVSLGLTLDQISLATVSFAGNAYPVSFIDSLSFHYDDRKRLVSYTGIYISQAYGHKFGDSYLLKINYRQRGLTFDDSPRVYPLDSTERRIVSYNRLGYSLVLIDSLRRYSSEGILESALQGSYNPTFPGFKRLVPNQKATIQGGNVVRLETYSPWSGELEQITLFSYDLLHYAPLATETFFGETSRNALSKKTILTSAGTVLEEHVYLNEYDSHGRLTQQLESLKEPNKLQNRALSLTHYYY